MQEFLLNPNLLYLMVMLGFLLALLSMLSPGTGILEVGAVFSLLFAGWGVYNVPINPWALIILLLGVVPFIVVVRRKDGRVYLALSLAALLLGAAYLFRGPAWWQPAVNPLLLLVVSLVSAGYLWVATIKVLETEHSIPAHDLHALMHAVGEAKTEIHTEGSIQVLGELWSARSQAPIPAGARVRVTGRDGFILEVETLNHAASTASESSV